MTLGQVVDVLVGVKVEVPVTVGVGVIVPVGVFVGVWVEVGVAVDVAVGVGEQAGQGVLTTGRVPGATGGLVVLQAVTITNKETANNKERKAVLGEGI